MTAGSIEGAQGGRRREWVEQASRSLRAAGFQKGGARSAVVELLAGQDCALTAFEIEAELRARDAAVGRASVYRALEQLEELSLVRRLEMGTGIASYERVEPSGEHHHHLVCGDCGRVVPFEDKALERAVGRVSGRLDFEIDEHEIVLRGRCPRCTS